MCAFATSVIVSILLIGNSALAANDDDKPTNSSTQTISSTAPLEPDDPSAGPSAPTPDPTPGTAPQQAAPQAGQARRILHSGSAGRNSRPAAFSMRPSSTAQRTSGVGSRARLELSRSTMWCRKGA